MCRTLFVSANSSHCNTQGAIYLVIMCLIKLCDLIYLCSIFIFTYQMCGVSSSFEQLRQQGEARGEARGSEGRHAAALEPRLVRVQPRQQRRARRGAARRRVETENILERRQKYLDTRCTRTSVYVSRTTPSRASAARAGVTMAGLFQDTSL